MVPPPLPPPATPSPRRFILPKERPRGTPLAQDRHPRPSQFNATPRFTFSSTPRPTPTQQEHPRATPSASRFLTPAPKTVNQQDVIEDIADEILHDSVESDHEEQDVDLEYGSADAEDDYIIEEPTPKRRRISSSPQPDLLGDEEDGELEPSIEELDEPFSSSLPILSSPPAPKRPISNTASRFLLSTPAPTPTVHHPSAQTPFLKPPRFRPPDPAEQSQAQSDPLPDQFSPHRKGQKYLPGGLAAEVRDWLVNIESAIPTTGAGKKDSWLVKIRVDEVSGGLRAGMSLVRGRLVHESGMVDTSGVTRVILAGEGAGEGLQKRGAVLPGKMVGIKGPIWEVVVEGEKWGVGVDWKLLSDS